MTILADEFGGQLLDLGGPGLVVVDGHSFVLAEPGANTAVRHLIDTRLAGVVTRPLGDAIAFLDIETTGFSAGAGTLVFLIGVATIRSNLIETRQYFLHEPSVEAALLIEVAARLAQCDALVTFNGRSFDVPLLLGRYDLHQMADPTPGRHVDLLHLARRVWGRRLRRSNLATLEARVLGVVREYDVPGSEAPDRYYRFLRDRNAEGILPVFEHNRRDLLSMVELAIRLGQMLTAAPSASDVGPSDLLGLGSLFEDAGQFASAQECYELALVGASVVERADAMLRLARLAERSFDLERSIQLLATVADFNLDQAVVASLELAKIFEHRRREPELALRYARRAMSLLRDRPTYPITRLRPEVDRRIRRLERKALVKGLR